MLKKLLSNIGYFALMLGLGFAIYYFVLSPNAVFNKSNSDYSSPSALPLFASKLPDENGVSQDLNQYKGKIVVLNFWATWCPPCREEMPELSELYKEYKNKNVVVLGVAIDELSAVKEFTTTTPVNYPIFASEDEGSNLNLQFGNDKAVLPYTVVINANGSVVETYFGRINKALLESAVRPLLAQ